MKREIFNLLSIKGIYLPTYQLNIAINLLEVLRRNYDGIESLNQLESFCYREFSSHTDRNKGAYTVDNVHCAIIDTIAKEIIAINVMTGIEKEYKSIYAASMEIVGNKSGTGNISAVLSGKKKTSYGYKFINK